MVKKSCVAEYLGIKVPESPFLNDTRIRRINAGRYEGQEVKGALAVVTKEDRVCELGAGIGVVGAVIAHNAKPIAMRSFEANPALIPHIQELYAINHLEEQITVTNEVLLAGPNRHDHVEFHIRNGFLGSSFIKSDRSTKHSVSVPTKDFEAFRLSFEPSVLIMDIEGAELELLEHANLEGIRAIVVEFHPGAYGIAGMRHCKSILKTAGFARNDDVSTRTVWTCERVVSDEF